MTLEREVNRVFETPAPGGNCGEDGRTGPVSRLPLEKNEKRDIRLSVVTVGELLAEPVEETPWQVEGLLPAGGLSILAGKPKAGKSTFARCLALAVARGNPILGRATQGGPVVYLGLEDKRGEVREHFRAMGAGSDPLHVHTGPAPRETTEAVDQLDKLIHEFGAKLAIIDTMLRFVRVRDVADYAEMTRALEPLLNLSRASECHVLAVYHAGKADREGLDAILGSVGIAAICDTGLILQRKSDGTRTLSAVQRYGADLPETVLELDPATRCIVAGGSVAERETAQLESAVLRAVAEGARSEKEIRDSVGGNSGKVGKTLRELHHAGRLTRTGEGKAGKPYLYDLASAAEASAIRAAFGKTNMGA